MGIYSCGDILGINIGDGKEIMAGILIFTNQIQEILSSGFRTADVEEHKIRKSLYKLIESYNKPCLFKLKLEN